MTLDKTPAPKRDHLVWMETASKSEPWALAIAVPFTPEEANAMCLIMEKFRPETEFVVSVGKPKVVTQRDLVPPAGWPKR